MLLKEFKINLKNNVKQKLIFEGIITLFAMTIMIIHSFNVHIPNMYIISIILFLLATFLVFYLASALVNLTAQYLALDGGVITVLFKLCRVLYEIRFLELS